jgi:hypothetical protein
MQNDHQTDEGMKKGDGVNAFTRHKQHGDTI